MKNIFILADFDHTITSIDSKSSWEVVSKGEKLPKEYEKKCSELYKKYSKYEVDPNIDFQIKKQIVEKWYQTHFDLMVEYKIDKQTVDKLSKNKNSMTLKKGTKELFEYTKKKKIPFIIISAGIKNVIEDFLESNEILYDNIHIIANEINYSNEKVVSLKNKLIHALNKNDKEIINQINKITKKRDLAIMIGDNPDDPKMIPKDKKSIKCGFLNDKKLKKSFEKSYDIILKPNETLKKIIEIIENK